MPRELWPMIDMITFSAMPFERHVAGCAAPEAVKPPVTQLRLVTGIQPLQAKVAHVLQGTTAALVSALGGATPHLPCTQRWRAAYRIRRAGEARRDLREKSTVWFPAIVL